MIIIRCLFAYILCSISLIAYSSSLPSIKLAEKPKWLRTSKLTPSEINTDDVGLGYYYETIERQTNIGLEERYYSNVSVLFDESGAEYASNLNIVFDPSYQQVYVHEVTIVRGTERLDRLNLNNFKTLATESDLSRFVYNGTYTAHCIIDDLRKDDKIVFSYTIKGFNPVFERKFSDFYFVQGYEPIGLLHIHYLVPDGRMLHFKSHEGAGPIQQSVIERGNVSYYYEENVSQAIDFVDYSPSWYNPMPWIECSEFDSWTQLSEWINRTNPIEGGSLGETLENFINALWKESRGNRYRFLELVTNFVQNDVRYLGISVGEYSHRANTPSKVFSTRYGDCKDKSVLMVAMLIHKGIDANLVLVNTVKARGLSAQLPSPLAFDHMVVKVLIDGRPQYIDPTISHQGGAIKERHFPDYGEVLVADGSSVLVQPNVYSQGKTIINETYFLKRGNMAYLHVETKYIGSHADETRTLFKSTSKNNVQKQYLSYYQQLNPTTELNGVMRYHDNFEDNVFSVYETYKISEIYQVEQGTERHYLGLFSNHFNESLPQVKVARPAPIALRYPFQLEHHIKVVNPEGQQIKFKQDHFTLQRQDYLFGRNFSVNKDTLQISYRLYFYNPFVSEREVENYVHDFKDRERLLYSGFYLDEVGFIQNEGSSVFGGKFNWWVLMFFVAFVLTFVFFIKRYNKSLPSILNRAYEEVEMHYYSIGGWLIVLMIGLILSVLSFSVELLRLGYFDENTWRAYTLHAGLDRLSYWSVLGIDFFVHIWLLFGFSYCLYLLANRRDIFPQTMFMVFFVACIARFLALVIAGFFFPKDAFYSTFTNASNTHPVLVVLSNFAFPIIWMFYLYHSERVRRTFIVPYGGAKTYSSEFGKPEQPDIDWNKKF